MSSSSSVSSLSPQNHGLTAGTTRPRTKSINTDHTQFQDKYQPQPQLQASSPSTAALEQIMSKLSQPQYQDHQQQHQQQRQQEQQQQRQHFVTNGISDVHHSHSHNPSGGGRQFFPLLPSTLPAAGHSVHDPMHSRSHSQATVVESSPTLDHFHYRPSATLPVDQDTFNNDSPGTPPAYIQNFHSVYSSKNNSSASLNMGTNFVNPTASSTGAISSSSLNTLVGASPLQHRPHTPLKSSFPDSITSDPHTNLATMNSGFSSAGADANPPEHPGDPPISTRKPSLFRSLSTKSGREQLMTPEKAVGSLPTMQHNGRGRRKCYFRHCPMTSNGL